MSRLTFVFLICAGVVACALEGELKTSGVNDEAAPLQSTVITVHGDWTRSEGFTKLGEILMERGFEIESSDASIGSINTAFKRLYRAERRRQDTQVRIVAAVFDGSARLRGESVTEWISSEIGDIRKRGQDGSPARRAWAELHHVAEQLGDDLTYE